MIFEVFVPVKPLLIAAGYIHRKKADDFIRPDGKDRFHIRDKTRIERQRFERVILSKKRTAIKKVEGSRKKMTFNIDIHYDLTIDGKHSVFHMPILLKEEVKRIRKFTKSTKLSTHL